MMHQQKWLRLAMVATMVGIIISVWWVSKTSVEAFENESVKKTQQHLLTIAQTAAQHLEELIERLGEEARFIANNPSVVQATKNGLSAQDVQLRDGYSLECNIFEDHLKDLAAIYRMDAKGLVQSCLPKKLDEIGTNFSQSPDVLHILNHHQQESANPTVTVCDCGRTPSRIFSTESGDRAISISVPIFERNQLVGIIRVVVNMGTINETIDDIRSGRNGYAQLFDDDGIMISHPDRTQIGTNIMAKRKQMFPKHDWSDMEALVSRMTAGETGVSVYHSAWWTEDVKRIVKKLAGFAPVNIGNERWSVAVIMGYDEIADPIKSQTRTMLMGASLVVLALFGAGIGFYQSEKKKHALLLETQTSQRLRDEITTREHAQEELHKAKQLAESANKTKSDFLANMSHEIRTPMTAILGFTENMLDSEQTQSDNLSCIYTIRRNGENLLSLINDILDLSKIEANKMTIESSNCQPCHVIAEAVSLLRVRAIAKDLTLSTEFIGAIPETIQSDPSRLRQILINLIGNSIKFTEVGTVRLVTSFIDEGSASLLQFDIIDTGRGMTNEQANKLFQPFTQAEASIAREFGGTGLGLTISQHLAELLGGTITVASTEMGVGTTFRVTVTTGNLDGVTMLDDPMSATIVVDNSLVAEHILPSDLQDLHILLAEDGPDSQKLIAYVLNRAGAHVTSVCNGQLALEAALSARDAGKPFDCILMDMQMPVLDGYEATKLLRQKNYSGSIIALTAHAMDSDRKKCLLAGCSDYATKPINRQKLIATIQKRKASKPLNATD